MYPDVKSVKAEYFILLIYTFNTECLKYTTTIKNKSWYSVVPRHSVTGPRRFDATRALVTYSQMSHRPGPQRHEMQLVVAMQRLNHLTHTRSLRGSAQPFDQCEAHGTVPWSASRPLYKVT